MVFNAWHQKLRKITTQSIIDALEFILFYKISNKDIISLEYQYYAREWKQHYKKNKLGRKSSRD